MGGSPRTSRRFCHQCREKYSAHSFTLVDNGPGSGPLPVHLSLRSECIGRPIPRSDLAAAGWVARRSKCENDSGEVKVIPFVELSKAAETFINEQSGFYSPSIPDRLAEGESTPKKNRFCACNSTHTCAHTHTHTRIHTKKHICSVTHFHAL